MSSAPHIAIIGAGPGGYVAAIRAAQFGARVTIIEREALGGVCLNAGCIPSKALLSVVELGQKMRKAADLGITGQGPVGYDLARMVARKNKVVDGLVKGIGTLFKAWNIEQQLGTGVLIDPRTVEVVGADGGKSRVSADAVIIATGSSWPNLPLFPVDGRQIITSKEALDQTVIPESILIVGGGVEGCEFASLFAGLGARVVLVELMPRLLPLEDAEIAAFLERELKKQGVEIHAGTTVEQLSREQNGITAKLKNGAAVVVSQILISVGRGFNSRGLGLEKIGIAVGRRGEITVDRQMQTNVTGVYAIGDVVGAAMLAHVASAQGKVAVEAIMGRPRDIRYDVIPAGIFTLPEIGRVGLTEEEATERGPVRVGRFRYAALGKAQATGDISGFVKVIADAKTDRLVGVHIVGAHATDLIHEAAMAMELGATAGAVAGMIHAHPTLAESILEAAEDMDGLAVHQARRRAT